MICAALDESARRGGVNVTPERIRQCYLGAVLTCNVNLIIFFHFLCEYEMFPHTDNGGDERCECALVGDRRTRIIQPSQRLRRQGALWPQGLVSSQRTLGSPIGRSDRLCCVMAE